MLLAELRRMKAQLLLKENKQTFNYFYKKRKVSLFGPADSTEEDSSGYRKL